MTPTPVPRISDYSLQTRLLIAFSVLLFVFLGFTGVVLDRAFTNSIEAGARERLQVQIYLLLSAVEEGDGEFYLLEDLQEPRFSQLNSGLYGYISSGSAGELWRSDSARALSLPDSRLLRQRLSVGESRFQRLALDQDEIFFVLSYGILWEDGISEYSFSVVENAAAYYSEISNFRTSLWSWLGGVALLLLLIQFFLMRWGLSPLSKVASDLMRIESGQKDKLEGSYPRELRGITDNLNMLIESERRQQERYRTTLGDLTHSLKTPLAVIAGVLPKLSRQPSQDMDQQVDAVNQQLERMNQIVSYQLQRAVQSDNSGSLANKHVNAAVAVEKVLDALFKVYAEKSMEVDTELDAKAVFHGDERDLMEVLGDVLDNAFKYGRRRIRIRVGETSNRAGETSNRVGETSNRVGEPSNQVGEPSNRVGETSNRVSETSNGAGGLRIVVEDDGPGIPEDKQEYVLQRGARADTLVQGQGIGLAVVTDIVNSCGGDIRVETSELGGACIVIRLNSRYRHR